MASILHFRTIKTDRNMWAFLNSRQAKIVDSKAILKGHFS